MAAYLMAASAALHVLGAGLGGGRAEGLVLLIPALVFVVLARAMLRRIWASGWLSLLLCLGSAAAALASALGPTGLPVSVFWGILVVNLAAALILFGAIWRGPVRRLR